MKIAVILPSRGLMFSQTADEILQNLKELQKWYPAGFKFFFSHRRPIPDCFEEPTNRALKDEEVTHLWFVEDDMILPPDCLSKMVEMDKACVTVNYPTTDRGDAAVLTIKNRVIYGGTGCTLVKREVFSELAKPYFRTDIMWIPKNKGNFIKFVGQRKTDDSYGLHDVNFFINLYKLDIPVHKLDFTVGQRKLIVLGRAGTNDGAHQIEEWHDVEEDRFFTLSKNFPVEETGNMVSVVVGDKEITCTKSHAETLISKGLAHWSPLRSVVIDELGLL